jgi:hypothetical protein
MEGWEKIPPNQLSAEVQAVLIILKVKPQASQAELSNSTNHIFAVKFRKKINLFHTDGSAS